MKVNKIIKTALVASALTASIALSTQAAAVTIVNAGFNDQTGGWTLANDARLGNPGGTAPWTWTTPLVGTVITFTETTNPTEGSGFGITYGGSDIFRQNVNIATAGDYLFSVKANALTGTARIAGGNVPLVNGTFDLFACQSPCPTNIPSSSRSPINSVVTANDWVTYTWTEALGAGIFDVGIRNRATGVYAIAYDDFSITEVSPVPEPETYALMLAGLGLIGWRARRRG